MKGTEVRILGNTVTHKKGNAFKSGWFQSTGKPIVKVTNFTDNSISENGIEYVDDSVYNENIEFILHTNDVIVQTVGSWPNNPASVVGKVVRVPRKLDGALLNQNAVLLRPKSEINRFFFYYLLKSDNFKDYIINTAQGAANQASITLDSIFRYNYYLPPLSIQRNIAAVLSAYDDLIENNNRRIALMEKMAEELYREWFVRLRFPGYEQVKIVKGVPEGWEVKRIRDIIRFEKGKSPKILSEEKAQDNEIYLNVDAIENGTHQFAARIKAISCTNNETLMLMDGARSSVVFHGHQGIVSSTFAVVRTETKFRAMVHEYFKANLDAMVSNNTGSAIPHANKEFIVRMCVKMPLNDNLVAEFNDKYWVLFSEKLNLRKKNKLLTTSRDRLLSRLMSGKIDVEQVDIQFPASMREEP